MKTHPLIIGLLVATCSNAQTAQEHFETARAEVEAENFRKSIKSYSKAIEMDDTNADYYFERGRSYFEVGDFLMAKSDLDRAILLDSTAAKAYHFRALYYFMSENYPASIEDNGHVITYSKDEELTTASYLNRGEAKYLELDTLGAYDDLATGLASDPDNKESLKVMSNVCHDLGKHEEALTYLNKLIELEPKEIGAYINKGFELEALGKYEDAIQSYNAAATIDGQEPLVYSNRAHANYKLGLYDAALKDANKSISNQPMNAFAYKTRAMIHIAEGKTEKACKDLKTAKEMGFRDEVQELQDKHCR